MAPEEATPESEMPPKHVQAKMRTIRRMLMVGAFFVAVGYLLLGSALFLEFTQFHPLIDDFVANQTQWSLAGGGPDRAGETLLNAQLAEIHRWPSTLLWMKLAGVGHILVGIFVALAAIVRTLSLVPERLGTVVTTSMSSMSSVSAADAGTGGTDGATADPADD
jgi:hypothetical protein